ncbi:MAG: AbrB/MazE/SpoVT family DNA-binding domain-containing protein [Anaerolineaceae bacterium]|nr:AbrB/MazE/SpoVT family DNA-binding domain-containing protein [Anaerolineaceae bacterium]
MTTMVKTRIVKIGNSQGIRIPKLLLDQSQLGDEVELEVEQGKIIIRASRPTRAGWDEQFKQMAVAEDDQLLDDELTTTAWDEEEWEW